MNKLSVLLVCMSALTEIAIAQPVWQACNGPYAGQVNALAVDRAGNIFAGTWYGGAFKSSNNGQSWNQMNSGLTDTCVTCFAFSPNGNIFAGTWSQGIFRSADNGQTWMATNSGLTDYSRPGVMAIDVRLSGVVFAAMSHGGVFRSTDGGLSWTNVSKGITHTSMTSLVVEPKSGYVFAASAYQVGGNLYRSMDIGDLWTSLSANTTYGIKGLTASPDGHIFFCVGQSSFVRRSTNLGDTWTSQWMGSEQVYPQALVATQRGGVFAGTGGYGVYQSTDDGLTWSRINNGLRHTWINSMASNSEGYVFAGTDSGGVYRTISPVTNVAVELTPTDFQLNQNYPNPFNPTTSIQFILPRRSYVRLTVTDLLGRHLGTIVEGELEAGTHTSVFDGNRFTSGIYFYRLQAGEYMGTKKMILSK